MSEYFHSELLFGRAFPYWKDKPSIALVILAARQRKRADVFYFYGAEQFLGKN